jgi:Fe-S cluster biogenesis protein NfuA
MSKLPTPTTWYAEITPNPATMKFVANCYLVSNGVTLEYKNIEEAKNSPLAQKLFRAYPFVTGFFVTTNFITVSKNDSVNWEDYTIELKDFIRQTIIDGNEVHNGNEDTKVTQADLNRSDLDETSTIDEKIIAVLEEYIRPAVESDGGAIHYKSFDAGVVTVELKGACSGCPSASLTLKSGIEQILKKMIPEVSEVVAEEV